MASRWLGILLAAAFMQGLLALSPVPVPEDEWEEFFITIRNPAYRLPTTTVPRHYEVSLTPYFDNPPANVPAFSFDGQVVIYLNATEANVREIVMHCNDITIFSLTVEYTFNNTAQYITPAGQTYTCEMPYSFLRIPTTEPLDLNTEYIARISFRGNFQTNMRGFYRSWYRDSTGRRWMGTTQFQPGHARQAFPCYDEPGFKATFDITMNREPDFSPTISNMPIKQNITLSNGRVAEIFYTTPKTSSYLLAFIVSHYDSVSRNNNTDRPFEIYARNNAGNTGDWSLEVGEALLEAMEEYTDYPYYSMAANMNMKQAAIPDFSAGAMENWGLLTYREALILYDPVNSNHFYRNRVANIVSHEVAHMWFGNLVTCAWWDNLWLNEGFARFYQYFLTDRVRPEMGYATRFVVEQFQSALLSDSIDSAHALTNPSVNDPTTVSAHFSTITYAKGAAILRMTQYLLGEATYVKGLRSYLKERAFNVAEPHHLFHALDVTAVEDQALAPYNGITIEQYFKTWSEQAGHPLLTVTINQKTGEMIVTQARWERNNGVSNIRSLWYIPVTWTRGGAPNFDNLKPSTILTRQVTVLQRGTSGNEWVIFNKQQTGFYRVNYDTTGWALITRALRGSNRTVINELNRAQIVDDVFTLARANVMTYKRALNILSFLEFEDAYAPWISAITGFNWLRRRLAHNAQQLRRLDDEIIRLSAAVTAKLGFTEVAGESYMDGLQRLHVNEFLCNVGDPRCLNAAATYFNNWKNGGFIPANMRPWVYCSGLRQGNAADFNFFWSRFLQEDLAGEIVVMLQTAGCTSDEASLWSYLDAIMDENEYVRPQDHTTALNSAVSGNEVNTDRMFRWLQNNVNRTAQVLGSAATPISYISGRLLTESQIQEFEVWLNASRQILGSAYNTGVTGAATARSNIRWYESRVAEVTEYLDTGYVEDVIEDIDEVEGGGEVDPDEGSGGGDGDGKPDSANVAALSLVTLIVTLAVNFVAG